MVRNNTMTPGVQRSTIEQATFELRRIAPGLQAAEAAPQRPSASAYLPPPFTLNPKEAFQPAGGLDPKLPSPVPSSLDYGVPIQAFPGPLPPPPHMLVSPLPPNAGF